MRKNNPMFVLNYSKLSVSHKFNELINTAFPLTQVYNSKYKNQ